MMFNLDVFWWSNSEDVFLSHDEIAVWASVHCLLEIVHEEGDETAAAAEPNEKDTQTDEPSQPTRLIVHGCGHL